MYLCKLHIVIYLILIQGVQLLAQDVACFTTEDTVGCAPFEVNFDNCSDAETVFYIYGDESRGSSSPNHVYQTPGIYTVVQRAGDNSDSDTLYDFIRVVESPEPEFKISNCDNYTVNVSIEEDIYDEYVIDFGDGSSTETIEGLETVSHPYTNGQQRTITVTGIYNYASCTNSSTAVATPEPSISALKFFRVRNTDNTNFTTQVFGESDLVHQLFLTSSNIPFLVFRTDGTTRNTVPFTIEDGDYSPSIFGTSTDLCGNTVSSEEFPLISLQANAVNNRNEIQLDEAVNSAQILRNEAVYETITNTDQYDDEAISCGIEYCYQAKLVIGDAEILSNKVCVTGTSENTPPPLTETLISQSNSNYQFYIDTNFSIKNLQISSINEPFTSQRTNFEIPVNISKSELESNFSCFRLSYIDDCDNASDTVAICPTQLFIEQNLEGYQFSWDEHTGTNTLNYSILYIKDGDTLLLGSSTEGTLSFTEDSTVLQDGSVVSSFTKNGQSIYSNTIEIENKVFVYLPTALIPEDSDKGMFYPKGKFIDTYKITIFNRTGQVIADLAENEPWLGTIDGVPVLPDVYIYQLEVIDFNSTPKILNGTVTVLK